MQKVLLTIVCLVVGLLLAGSLLPDVVTETASDSYSEPFSVTTGGGETTTTETLSYAHYYTDLTGLSATSDNANDTPVIMTYDSDTYEVGVSGLEASASRILTLTYLRDAHTQFTGFAGFIRLIPFIAIVGLVIAALWALFGGIHIGGRS